MQDNFAKSLDFSLLRRYLSEGRISNKLIVRIQRNAQHAMSQMSKAAAESDIKLLQIVSEPLLTELHYELYNPVLTKHHLFKQYSEYCPPAMRKVCHTAVSTKMFSRHDLVFSIGEIPHAPQMFFILHGHLEYTNPTEAKLIRCSDKRPWISEAVLWTSWMHVGELTALTNCQLVLVDALAFHRVAGQYPIADIDLQAYAQRFVDELNVLQESQLSDMPIKVLRGSTSTNLSGAPPSLSSIGKKDPGSDSVWHGFAHAGSQKIVQYFGEICHRTRISE